MAYDEGLAERIRGVLDEQSGLSEKRMFGGVAFLVRGHMSVGIVGDKLMVRLGPEAHDCMMREPHARAMDFTGKPMKGFVYVEPSGYESDADLRRWVDRGVSYAISLPEKAPGESMKPRQRPTKASAGRPVPQEQRVRTTRSRRRTTART